MSVVQKFELEAIVKLKHIVIHESEKGIDSEHASLCEEGEYDLKLNKDMADCTYTDNQSCRFDDVEVILVKAREVK